MSKKTILVVSLFSCLAVIGVLSNHRTDSNDYLTLATIEALAERETGPENTGPAEEKKCYGGGHRMVCRCINDKPCTGTDCY